MRTRKGLDWTDKFARVAEAGARPSRLHHRRRGGALDHNGAPDFAALQAALSEGRSQDLIYFVFDLLFEDGEDLREPAADRAQGAAQDDAEPQGARMPGTSSMSSISSEPGDAVLKSACKLNLEGIISKRAGAPYQSGRTESWIKSKCRGGQEVVIGGWSGSASNLRSLLVGVYRGDHLVHTGRVGTGFNHAQRRRPSEEAPALKTDQNPFGGKGAPRKKARTGTGSSRSLSPRSSSPAGPGTALCARPPSRACARTSRRARCAPSTRRTPEEAELPAPAPKARGNRIKGGSDVVMGVVDLKAGQAALAGAGQLHQARPRAVSREGRAVDDRASQGPALLHHPRAGRHQAASGSSSAMPCRACRTCSRSSKSRATASPISRSTASKA